MVFSPAMQLKGSLVEYALILFVLAALVVLIIPLLRAVGRRVRGTGRSTRKALLVAMVLAFVLRVGADPYRPMVLFDEWEYAEGARMLLVHHRGMICVNGDVNDCRLMWESTNPSGYPMLVALATSLLGPWGDGAHISLVLGVLSVPLLFTSGLYLLRDEGAALAAAVFLSLLPLHVRYSTTRASEPTSVFLIILYLLLVGMLRRRRTIPVLWTSLLLLVYASATRPENLLLILPLMLALLERRPGWKVIIPTILLVVLSVAIAPAYLVEFGGNTQRNIGVLSRWWVGVDHHSVVVFLLALIGLAVGTKGQERLLLAGLFGAFFILFAVQATYLGAGDQDRHLLPSYPPFLLLAGAGAAAVWRRGDWWITIPLVLFFLYQTVELYSLCPGCDRPGLQEPAFALEARKVVGPGCAVVTRAPFFVTNAWERPVLHVSLAGEIRDRVQQGQCLYFYENAFCDPRHSSPYEPTDWCAQMHENYTLTPVAELPDMEDPVVLYRIQGSRV